MYQIPFSFKENLIIMTGDNHLQELRCLKITQLHSYTHSYFPNIIIKSIFFTHENSLHWILNYMADISPTHCGKMWEY